VAGGAAVIRPCTASEAVSRALALLADPSNATAGYLLGAGDYRDGWTSPWTHGPEGTGHGGDCRVAFLWCYRVPASRRGYNVGSWSSVSDCVNYNSLIEDSEHAQDLVVPVTDAPQAGDVLCYPTIYLPGHPHPWIGHGAIVLDASKWDGSFASLEIMQVCGPPYRTPAAVRSSGAHFDEHSKTWPRDEHRSRLLRVV
jgi:hypothetical protein